MAVSAAVSAAVLLGMQVEHSEPQVAQPVQPVQQEPLKVLHLVAVSMLFPLPPLSAVRPRLLLPVKLVCLQVWLLPVLQVQVCQR